MGKRKSFRQKVVIVGANAMGIRVARNIQADPDGKLAFQCFFDDRGPERLDDVHANDVIYNIEALPEYVRQNRTHLVFITLPLDGGMRMQAILEGLQATTASVYFLPNLAVFEPIRPQLINVYGYAAMALCESPLKGWRGRIKSLMDLFLATCFLLLLAPLLLLIACCIKLTSPGPVLFKQRRWGMDGEEILVYKFRTMRVCEDGEIIRQASRNDRRITPVGAFLRKTSFDELPQFINVLQGNMSIVGPRPHAVAHNEMYSQQVSRYMLRHKVRPGMTGWAQVHGYRGETQTVDLMQARVELDLEYLKNWSLWFDLKILALTPIALLRCRNAY